MPPDETRPLVWLKGEIRTPPFSADARVEAGFLLRRLQRGERLDMPQARSMPGVGARCLELRVVDRSRNWRVLVRVDADAIVILEVFDKKSQRTPATVIEDCRRRLRSYDSLHRQG